MRRPIPGLDASSVVDAFDLEAKIRLTIGLTVKLVCRMATLVLFSAATKAQVVTSKARPDFLQKRILRTCCCELGSPVLINVDRLVLTKNVTMHRFQPSTGFKILTRKGLIS